MKTVIIAVLFSLSFYAQKQNNSVEEMPLKAVVSATKMNVVYRGFMNPISIAVPDCKSFTASGSGLNEENGKYYLSPGAGLFSIVKLKIVLNDGSEVIEEHKFRIVGISSPSATIDDRNCIDCIVEFTKQGLQDAIIKIKIEGLLFDLSESLNKITGFVLKIPKNKPFVVSGNTFTKEINEKINSLKTGTEFIIKDITYSFPGSENYMLPRINPLKIKIVEEKIDYYQSKEFIKDSLNAIKKEKKLNRKSK